MISNYPGPYLVLLEEKCRRNIRRMAEKARNAGVNFRPHFKTHQGSAFYPSGFDESAILTMDFAVDGTTGRDVLEAFHLRAHGGED